MQKDRAADTVRPHELRSNAIHIRAAGVVNLHRLPVQHTVNAPVVMKAHTFHECSAENQLLHIGLLIEDFPHDSRKVKAEIEEPARDFHCSSRSVRILENPGIRHHADKRFLAISSSRSASPSAEAVIIL